MSTTRATTEDRSAVRTLLRLWPYVRPVRARLFTAAFVAVVASCTGLVIPLVLKWMVDGPVADRDPGGVWLGALYLFLLGVAEALLFGLRRWLVARPLSRVEARMRAGLYGRLQRLPVAFHDRWASGQLLSRGTTDLMLLRQFLAFPLTFLLVNGVTILVGVVIMLAQDWVLGLVILGPTIPVMWTCAVFERRYATVARAAQDQVGDLTTVVEESVLGIRVVKGFGRHRSQAHAFRELALTLRGTELRKARLLAVIWGVIVTLPELAIGAALVLGVVRVSDGDLSAGTLVAFLSTALALRWPVDSIGFLLAMSQEAATATERYFEAMDEPPEEDLPTGRGQRPAAGRAERSTSGRGEGSVSGRWEGSAPGHGESPGPGHGDKSTTGRGQGSGPGHGDKSTAGRWKGSAPGHGDNSTAGRGKSPAPGAEQSPTAPREGDSAARHGNGPAAGHGEDSATGLPDDLAARRRENPATRQGKGSAARHGETSAAELGDDLAARRKENPAPGHGDNSTAGRGKSPDPGAEDSSTAPPAADSATGLPDHLADRREESPAPARRDARPGPHRGGAGLRFENVRFRYPDASPDSPPLLTGVDLHIRPGESMALVGATGSGKTTLTALVPRLHEVTSGRITLDGVDITEMPREELRAKVAVAFEEPTLFSTSVGENVLMGARPDAGEPELERALEVAQAAGFVHALPQGTGTRVGEQGLSLSGGQRQRLALARAVVGRPDFLVLDDPLSALDVHTEAAVEAALRHVLADTTALIVAHRPSTVLLADRVALLSGGRIAAVGTHHELLRTNAEYAHLMSGTSGHFRDTEESR
ncbi:ABC transporter transmembrane domain-containing protein [Streptomyces sp. NPDC048665]|uniref:ABC transporter transmembrane domain-containing protein n=1 Tax=Streptomyces sp. NPDC048665 TaxID=3155490 RepID=UPI0034176952